MTGHYVLSPAAKDDIEKIWDYTVQRWGIQQAEFYTRQLWKQIEIIAAHPAMGRACPQVRMGYYKYPSGSHILFFSLIEGGIDIVRILHKRMDFEQHFDS